MREIVHCSIVDIILVTNSTDVTELSNATDTALDYGGCRYPELKWCLTERHLSLVQYLLGLLFIGVGYPIATVLCYTIYSKILGPFPQVHVHVCSAAKLNSQ